MVAMILFGIHFKSKNLLNVKRVPNVDDILLSWTDIHDVDCISTSDHPGNDQDFLDENHSEAHIELMALYVNELSQEGSTFNSSLCDQERSILLKLKSGVISIQPTIFPPIVIQSDAPSLIEESKLHSSTNCCSQGLLFQ